MKYLVERTGRNISEIDDRVIRHDNKTFYFQDGEPYSLSEGEKIFNTKEGAERYAEERYKQAKERFPKLLMELDTAADVLGYDVVADKVRARFYVSHEMPLYQKEDIADAVARYLLDRPIITCNHIFKRSDVDKIVNAVDRTSHDEEIRMFLLTLKDGRTVCVSATKHEKLYLAIRASLGGAPSFLYHYNGEYNKHYRD